MGHIANSLLPPTSLPWLIFEQIATFCIAESRFTPFSPSPLASCHAAPPPRPATPFANATHVLPRLRLNQMWAKLLVKLALCCACCACCLDEFDCQVALPAATLLSATTRRKCARINMREKQTKGEGMRDKKRTPEQFSKVFQTKRCHLKDSRPVQKKQVRKPRSIMLDCYIPSSQGGV